MNRLLIIICFCLFAVELNSQVLYTDSSETQQTKFNNIFSHNLTVKNKFDLVPKKLSRENRLLIPEDLFLLRSSFPFNDTAYNYDDELTISPVLITSPIENAFLENRKELITCLHNIYLQSKPTQLQKIFNVVNVSGAFLLAGYHIWKYYIKK